MQKRLTIDLQRVLWLNPTDGSGDAGAVDVTGDAELEFYKTDMRQGMLRLGAL